MRSVNDIDPSHEQVQGLLRVVGPVVAGLGLVLVAVGFISFFSAFGSFEPPRYFWCSIVGIPILGLGLMMSKLAYLGHVARYISHEVAPVQKETFNYLARGTSEGVRTLAQAAGRGLASGMATPGERAEVPCPGCQGVNPPESLYCSQCGTALARPACAGCGAPNDPSAKFCNRCGRPLA